MQRYHFCDHGIDLKLDIKPSLNMQARCVRSAAPAAARLSEVMNIYTHAGLTVGVTQKPPACLLTYFSIRIQSFTTDTIRLQFSK